MEQKNKEMSDQKTIAQALSDTWTQSTEPLSKFLDRMAEQKKKTGYADYKSRYPLYDFLRDTHKYKYIPLCRACGIEPMTLGRWLAKTVGSLTN